MSDITPTGWDVPPLDGASAQTMKQVRSVEMKQMDRVLMAYVEKSTRRVP